MMIRTFDSLQAVVAAIAQFWAILPVVVQVLVLLQAIDMATRLLVGLQSGKLSSRAIWIGIKQKVSVLLLVGFSTILEFYLAGTINVPLAQVVAAWYVAHESISILENATLAGLPIPPQLKDILKTITEGRVNVDTGGGSFIDGDVSITGGDFIGRDRQRDRE